MFVRVVFVELKHVWSHCRKTHQTMVRSCSMASFRKKAGGQLHAATGCDKLSVALYVSAHCSLFLTSEVFLSVPTIFLHV